MSSQTPDPGACPAANGRRHRAPVLRRSAAATVIAATALAGVSLATASPASAAGYRCTTSEKSIDDPAYSGPWADNWDFTVKICAKRSGSSVSTFAKVSWDGPVYGLDADVFDGAYFQLQVKKSVAGTDPVVKKANFYRLEPRLERADSWGDHNGSFTTPTITYKAGHSKALGDGELRLDFNNDGAGYSTHLFTASPVV
ncbi:hypothetical protein [Streptomyces chattanoogensis]|uniref:hypothetical protein n=1 Tax=Streptomyces chattanoogensis TaxID=66876 RepID=UPI00368962BB